MPKDDNGQGKSRQEARLPIFGQFDLGSEAESTPKVAQGGVGAKIFKTFMQIIKLESIQDTRVDIQDIDQQARSRISQNCTTCVQCQPKSFAKACSGHGHLLGALDEK